MTTKTEEMKLNRKTSGKWAWVLIVMVLSLAAFAYFDGERMADMLAGVGEFMTRSSNMGMRPSWRPVKEDLS